MNYIIRQILAVACDHIFSEKLNGDTRTKKW